MQLFIENSYGQHFNQNII